MEHEKIKTSIQTYIEKYKELEVAKADLISQKDQLTKQLTNVEQNMIFLQGSVRALQELLETPSEVENQQKEVKEKK